MTYLSDNYLILLIASDITFFVLGALIGSLITSRVRRSIISYDKFLRNTIVTVVTAAWFLTIIVETVDRTYNPDILIHLIFGMTAGAIMDINFTEVLLNFGKMKASHTSKKLENDNDKTETD